jgi:hypothetical protein
VSSFGWLAGWLEGAQSAKNRREEEVSHPDEPDPLPHD